MYLYYDTTTKVFSLKTDNEVVFLGPITHAQLLLQSEYGLTEGQARQAVLEAFNTGGGAVSIDHIKKSAKVLFTKVK